MTGVVPGVNQAPFELSSDGALSFWVNAVRWHLMRPVLGLAVIAACGDSLSGPDAEMGILPDPSEGLVSIVFRGDLGHAGIPVFFQDADSSVRLSTRTDAAGRANAFMGAGGFVSIAVADRVLTYAGVAPGDELVFEQLALEGAPATTAVRVRVPAHPGAVAYRLYSSCGNREIFGAQLQPIDVSLGACGAVEDMLAATTTSTGAERSIFRRDVGLELGTTILFEGTYEPEQLATITAIHVPPEIPLLIASQALIHGADEVFPGRGPALTIAKGTGTGTVTMPMPVEATMSTHLEAQNPGTAGGFHVIEWQPVTTDVVISYNRDRVRSYAEYPKYLVDGPVIAWSEVLDGFVADGVIAELTWTGGDLVRRHWTVLGPRTSDPVLSLPVLPVGELVPLESTVAVLRLDSFKLEGGYDRARGAFRLGKELPRGRWFADGASGRVVYQSLD